MVWGWERYAKTPPHRHRITPRGHHRTVLERAAKTPPHPPTLEAAARQAQLTLEAAARQAQLTLEAAARQAQLTLVPPSSQARWGALFTNRLVTVPPHLASHILIHKSEH